MWKVNEGLYKDEHYDLKSLTTVTVYPITL